jgi:hypothetical protein
MSPRRHILACALAASLLALSVLGPACVGDDGATESSSAALCDEYCTKVIATCTGGQAMYSSKAQCLSTCSALRPETETSAAGNTVRCRLNQVQAGNCAGAGLTGGGACGQPCEGFCRVTAKACAPDLLPLGGEGSCLETCRTEIRYDPAKADGVAQPLDGEDTLNCRAQHLLLALSEPSPHCLHLRTTASPCNRAPAAKDAGAD